MSIRQSKALLISLFLLGIAFLPFPIVLQTSNRTGTLEVGPEDSDSAHIRFPLLPGQYVEVEVTYVVRENPGSMLVRGEAWYRFPRKQVGESLSSWSFWNQTHVAFRMSWEQVQSMEGPLSPIFFRGLGFSIFYEGETSVTVHYTIKYYSYINYYVATAMLGCTLGLVIWRKKMKPK